jgi:N-acylneuraminate cytidylyltransferase
MSADTVAIIPARGGSKGIPRKNLQMLAGMPLVAHAISCARRAGTVQRVVVTTDDAEIAEVAGRYGAEVIRRPAKLGSDTASSESALLHALDELRSGQGYEPEVITFLQCTSPLTRPEDIDGTVQVLRAEGADSAVAVAPFYGFLWKKGPDGEAVSINHDPRTRPRRQERDLQYLETGAVYAMYTRGFRQARHRFFGKTAFYVMPTERSLEIDSPTDLKVAEVLLGAQQERDRLNALPTRVGALILDFDGVLTDNRVMVFEDGREAVFCNRSDGWGLAQLSKMGLPILVLSSEVNAVVQKRCTKLKVTCRQGIEDKAAALREWLGEQRIRPEEAIYVGNDVNDLGCFRTAGCGVAVGDAHSEARAAAKIVLSAPGGRGAVREMADLISRKMTEGSNGQDC